jgi:8-oxo-dGTP pyrophosphatase MutT (NUDIX family)
MKTKLEKEVSKKMNWRKTIKNYEPWNEQEAKDKAIMIQCMETFDNILKRDNEIAHITSSGFVVNKNRNKVLMVHHNIYNSWSWTGGHADGEEDLLQVALKEVKEETGVKHVHPVQEDILSLDILTVIGHYKNGNYIAPHLHLSLAYLLEADENDPLFVKSDENSNVQWIHFEEIETYSNEPHMIRIYKKVIDKI